MNLSARPTIPAPLDLGFLPAVLYNRSYAAAAKASGQAVPLVIGLERECGLLSRFETVVKPTGNARAVVASVNSF